MPHDGYIPPETPEQQEHRRKMLERIAPRGPSASDPHKPPPSEEPTVPERRVPRDPPSNPQPDVPGQPQPPEQPEERPHTPRVPV